VGYGIGQTSDEVLVRRRGWLRRLIAFLGPAYLVAVGYMDPGNWATDIEGGSRFGYSLLWVLVMSNLMAILLQTLSARLGLVTGLDLAQACRREYPRPVVYSLWVLAEIAIAATDLAEALGTIIGLNLLFGMDLLWGCALTAFDTFLLIGMQRFGVRKIEAVILTFVATIGACFLVEIFLAKPDVHAMAAGLVPRLDFSAVYIIIGILGATVMPHNLYLHSSLVQSRAVSNTLTGRREACRFNFVDSLVALNLALLVNGAIYIMAAANFHAKGIEVTEIQQAHHLLERLLGDTIAPIAFAVALIAAGQSSTITGTISGQIVMEGFLNLRIRPWLRRLVTRTVALAPAVVAIIVFGEKATYQLLILSQVALSLQLPFAIVPLLHFTSDRKKMGSFVNARWAIALGWICVIIIVGLNASLVYSQVMEWLREGSWRLWAFLLPALAACIVLLAYITVRPWVKRSAPWDTGLEHDSAKVAEHIEPLAIKEVGVAIEHTQGDAQVVSAAITVAKSHKARLTLLHIVDTPGAAVYGEESGSLHGAEDKAYIEALAREIEERDLPVEVDLRFGDPAQEIIRAARESDFDMLVMGSHGHRGIGDLIHGATVDSVRHALEIPVIIVRCTGTEQATRTNTT